MSKFPRCEAPRWCVRLVHERQAIASTWNAVVIALTAVAYAQPVMAQAADVSTCNPMRCEITLTRVLAASDEPEDLQGAFGNAPIYVERDRQGRFFMAVRHGIAIFGPDGEFIQRLGRSGGGPGEFGVPSPPLVGPGDSIHVFDARQRRLTVLGSDLVVSRVTAATRAPVDTRPDLIRSDGTYILAGQIRSSDRIGYPLHRLSSDGELLNSFGTDTPQYRADIPLITGRVAGLSADGSVWTAPPGRYVIERWDPETSRRLARLDIRPAWFAESVRYPPTWDVPPVLTIEAVWEDDNGMLWVLIHDADANWTPPEQTGEFSPTPDDEAKRYDTVIEVIDPQTQEVIASRRVDNVLYAHPQSRLLASYQTENPFVVAFDVWTAHLRERSESK